MKATVKALDKDAHPVRFALVTSVGNSLVVTAVLAGLGQLLKSRLFAYRIPLWLVLFLGTACLSVMCVTSRLRQKDRGIRPNNQVFFILCAFNEKRWVAGFVQDVHNSLDRRGLDLVLKVPERDYVHFGQARHLQNLSERLGKYVGGIISPAEPELLRPDLTAFCVSAGYPVIFVDIDPFETAEDYPAGTAFVGYVPEVVGRCAADYVAEHAKRSHISGPRVLVIGSKLHTGRQVEFASRLKSRFQDAEIIIDDDAGFNRTRAREIVRENLRSKAPAVPHYIFCTNDEMALGAVDALGTAGVGNDGSVVVVGVDGTPEARALIDAQQTPLRATVVQDSCRMAEIATDLLDRAIRGKPIERYNCLSPRIYSRDR
jgi:ABC-type sugar transport system substrate-binding protein